MHVDETPLAEVWGKVHLNDRLVSADEAAVSALDRGILYGDGIFETVRVYSGRPFMLEAHLSRMAEGASRVMLDLPDPRRIRTAVAQVLEGNALEEAYLRITVTRGPTGKMWSELSSSAPTLLILAKPFVRPDFGQGLRLTVSRFRIDETSPLSGVKHSGILPKALARKQAQEAGADDALMLDTRGYVGEATSSNVFWVIEGRLCTPSLNCGVLPGVTRQIVVEIASEQAIEVSEGEFTLKEAKRAVEMFLTSSTWEIAPVRELDGRVFTVSQKGVAALIHRRYLERIHR